MTARVPKEIIAEALKKLQSGWKPTEIHKWLDDEHGIKVTLNSIYRWNYDNPDGHMQLQLNKENARSARKDREIAQISTSSIGEMIRKTLTENTLTDGCNFSVPKYSNSKLLEGRHCALSAQVQCNGSVKKKLECPEWNKNRGF